MVPPKRAPKQKEVWAIRFWLDPEGRLRDRALFDLAIEGKPRGRDLVLIRIGDPVIGDAIGERRSSFGARRRVRVESGHSDVNVQP